MYIKIVDNLWVHACMLDFATQLICEHILPAKLKMSENLLIPVVFFLPVYTKCLAISSQTWVFFASSHVHHMSKISNRINTFIIYPESFSFEPWHNAPKSWDDLSNPQNWLLFTFQPKHIKSKVIHKFKYFCHKMPCSATLVPMNESGRRLCYDSDFNQMTNVTEDPTMEYSKPRIMGWFVRESKGQWIQVCANVASSWWSILVMNWE